jgi:uncharacterized glyoxalase superfamily protein PhnB
VFRVIAGVVLTAPRKGRALAPDACMLALRVQISPGMSPTLHVQDMRRALDFYVGSLGFTCIFRLRDEQHPDIPYAVVQRDQVKIHIQLSDAAAGLNSCYITVDNADALYAEFQKAGVKVTRPIEDSNYGMRDFNIADIDGTASASGNRLGRSDKERWSQLT